MREQVRIGQVTHICEPFERSYFVTNWCLAWKGLEDIFPSSASAAANISEKDEEKEKEKTESTTTINVVKRKLMVLGYSMEKATPNRCTSFPFSPLKEMVLTRMVIVNSTIMCQTSEGVWCDFAANVKAMKLVEEYLKTDPMLENF